MLKLKLRYFGHMMRRADSLEKTLMLGKIEGRRRWLDGITDPMDMSQQLNNNNAVLVVQNSHPQLFFLFILFLKKK